MARANEAETGRKTRTTMALSKDVFRKIALGASLIIEEKKAPEIPKSVVEALKELRKTWMRPDGEELVDALSVARCARELSLGLYYRWRFDRGEPDELILEWLKKRKAYHRELRELLKHPQEHLDSPLLCWNAAQRAHNGYEGDLPIWDAVTWEEWRDIKDKVEPVSEGVWVDDYLAKDAAAWAKKHLGVVWYDVTFFGERVAELAGLPLQAGGADAEAKILSEKGDRSIVASIKAHGTGRDGLQRIFNDQLITSPPPSGAAMEQLLGRLHRVGQEQDEVFAKVYRHTPEMREAFDKALMLAGFLKTATGNDQKMISANVTFETDLNLRIAT
jgi:hypothetical protein